MLLVLMSMVNTISVKAADYDFEAKNSDGVTIYYKKVGYEAVVVGSGVDSTGNVNIPSIANRLIVNSIGSHAFASRKDLKSITIPSTVKRIEQAAFYKCESLKEVKFAENSSLEDIEVMAFWSCISLTEFSIPNTVEHIGNLAFKFCPIPKLFIPSQLTNIEPGAFAYCYKLNKIEVAPNNRVYDSRNNCNAIIDIASQELIAGCKNTIIPSTIKSIGKEAFAGCYELNKIIIPPSVMYIKDCAFADCYKLEDINFPQNLVYIGYLSFVGCDGLNTVYIPSSVSIGQQAFPKKTIVHKK